MKADQAAIDAWADINAYLASTEYLGMRERHDAAAIRRDGLAVELRRRIG